ncbi:hypothetical protein BKK51_12505 [Rodentibacter trehalosifermentans]|uniref:Uncharacterized protein n=2 Tax=Rodentibacter trehalosifermentans TaxID=1908263 RepID=A0A1V3IT32_9PAST|nr:hypothetical protein BKK51_12505 [Rodentibacter trehalosifermentans]OOF45415.1 hypothetical protein BKK52_12610 [Rodentibacter trehalosifermentans]OOF50865.1 hypothetical protein BKK53_07870 [Rodentibacter trehalosifermentans]
MKKILSAVVFASVLTACSQTSQTAQIIGKRDMYGCLVSAGESFSYTKQRCISPLNSEEHYKRMRAIRTKNKIIHK